MLLVLGPQRVVIIASDLDAVGAAKYKMHDFLCTRGLFVLYF